MQANFDVIIGADGAFSRIKRILMSLEDFNAY